MPTSSWPSAVREFAFCPDRFTRLSAEVERFDDGRVCVLQGTVWAAVSGVRAAPGELEELVERVRALVPPEKHAVWWLDPDAEPADLHARLVALGFREPADRVSELYAMACTDVPATGGSEIDVRPAESFDDFRLAQEVSWRAFDTPPERRQNDEQQRLEFEAARDAGVPATFLAYLDGRAAGTARSIYSDRGVFLIAGAVEEWARGRGVYRALVRARWDDAVARGTPVLVTESIPGTSYPILTRLGFGVVGTMRRLEDPR